MIFGRDFIETFNLMYSQFIGDAPPKILTLLKKISGGLIIEELSIKYPDIEKLCYTCETGQILDSHFKCQCSSCQTLISSMGDKYYKEHEQRMIDLYNKHENQTLCESNEDSIEDGGEIA
jgi:hypothetical protein